MRAVALSLAVLVVVGCSSAPTPSPSPIVTGPPTPSATPTDPPIDFPTDSAIDLEPGRYSSQPPFAIDFTFEIFEPGWGSGHLNQEFFDVLMPARIGVMPDRWVAFALPETLHGADEVSVEGLSPAQAVVNFAANDDWTVSEPRNYTIDGRYGMFVDISVDAPGSVLFAVGTDRLQLDPAYDVRVIAVPHEGGLLLVLAMAPDGEVDEAWADSQPIIESISW